MSRRIIALTGAVLVTIGLSACGKVGALERPGPLYGQGRSTTAEADKAARAQDPSRPVDTVDPRDRTTDPAPPRTLPIEGSGNNPAAVGPQGALPNPYAKPR